MGSVAEITGGENEAANESEARKVRIWAGASKANRYTAPFRVLQNGKVIATDADISGTVNATDGEFNGMVRINGGSILLNKDGSGSIASGKIYWDSYGNITIKDISAINGSFSGLLNATNGIRYGVTTTTAAYYSMTTSSCMVITRNTSSGSGYVSLNLPSSPNTGQLITIKNLNSYKEVQINGNGHGILRQNSTEAESFILLALGRVKQFIYDGSNWHQVGQYEY